MMVLHLISTLATGGAERQLSYLASAQASRGYDVHVACLRGGPNADRLERSGANLHLLSSSAGSAKGGFRAAHYDPRVVWRILRLILSLRPDVVQTWLQQMDVIGGLACKLLRTPWILREPSTRLAYARSFRTSLRRALGRVADVVVANSEGGRKYWSEACGRIRQCEVIRNCIPDEMFVRDGRHNEPRVRVTYVGRFEKYKNVGILVEVAAIVCRHRPDVEFLLCGDGPEKESLAASVQSSDARALILLPGLVTDVRSILNSTDVFVSISSFEGCPNAVLEAMAAGCAIVISDIGGHRELLDARSAVYVASDDADAIAGAILRVLSDQATLARLQAAAARRAESFKTFECFRQYDAVYRSLIH